MENLKKYLVIVAVLLVLVVGYKFYKGSQQSSPPPATTTATTSAQETMPAPSVSNFSSLIQGSWRVCSTIPDNTGKTDGINYIDYLKFTGNRFEYTSSAVDGVNNCDDSQRLNIMTVVGTYDIEGPSVSGPNIFNVVYRSEKMLVTQLTELAVIEANRNAECGITTWALNVPVDISQIGCKNWGIPGLNECPNDFSILSLSSPNTLSSGGWTSELTPTCTVEQRPTKLIENYTKVN